MAQAKIDIVDFEPETKVPDFVEDVQAIYESGKAGAFTVEHEDVVTTLRKIHAAARYLGLTARKRKSKEEGNTTTLVFTVKERKERKEKTEADDEDDAAE